MLLGVDVGGTFTDAVLVLDGRVITAKSPTTPADQSEGVLAAVQAALERAGRPGAEVRAFAHGMTVATNALLEGRGARTALVATEGFTDIVELGRQNRAELYRLCAARPAPMVPAELRFAASERMTPDGVLRELSPGEARSLAEQIGEADAEAVAVVLLHAYRHPEHEQAIAAALADAVPGVHVSLSHEVVGTFREYERAATTEVDAALSPLLAGYLRRLLGRAHEADLPEPSIMQSNGGLIDVASAAGHAAFTVLSGPAGGAAGAAFVARAAGIPDALCFDMGGTSCDVCVVDGGAVQERGSGEIAGRPLALPMLAVHTVGAGGGSIAWRDGGGALRVGPRSSGAQPGPACYGRGGTEPTVTDANLMLGYLSRDAPLAGGVELDADAAADAIGGLASELGIEPIACADGIVRVADSEMVRALRVVTVERGIDPRRYALLAFGGAGGLHAARIAEELGIRTILCPRASGVLAALGLVVSPRRRDVQRSVFLSGDDLSADAIASAVSELGAQARRALGEADAELLATYELRYAGQAFELAIRAGVDASPEDLRDAFEAEHDDRYGYHDSEQPLELVTIRVAASLAGPELELAAGAASGEDTLERGTRPAVLGGSEVEVAVLRGSPPPGTEIAGPAVVELRESTLLVPEGWAGSVDRGGTTKLERSAMTDPVELQILAGALRAICEEMGAVLIRSAHSPNIKERRDASTALFDPAGEMVMQAEHIPVHLGAMPAAVAAVLGERHAPGRSWILNDPYQGGTHLPDITVITPIFADGDLMGFAANRAHHADVGGPTPGSMPADSTTLADEGVVIAPRLLDDAAIDELTARMRRPDQRRADLRAQLAAGRIAERRLLALRERVGPEALWDGFAAVLDYAERRTRTCLEELPDGTASAHDVLEAREGDLQIVLTATVSGDRLTLDFTGTADQHEGNLNCPMAVTRSACYFAVRVLTDPEIPPSAGAYRPIEVIAPEGCLLNARSPAAVVGGNVETSSRVADIVLRAFGRALGQGTMNNVTLGNDDVVYYETIGGGQGACADADGPSGVHVAMSNTLNTPVEALELEFPLRMVRYELRRGSGGAGAHRGGDGVVRELEALAPLHYSLITERRRVAPPGANGGEDGATGRNLLDGQDLPAKAIGELAAGQRLRIETPGGGGNGVTPRAADDDADGR